MYLPLLIRAAYVFLLRSYESRERGAHCPPFDGPIEKSPTAEEWDIEIDCLQSLMDEQDRKYGFESESLILGDQDFVEEELVEKPNLADEVSVEESKSTVVEHIDFLGVDDNDFVYLPSIANYVHCSKLNLVPREHLEALQFLKTIRQLLYSKYLFLWSGRVQFLVQSLAWGGAFMGFIFVDLINFRIPRFKKISLSIKINSKKKFLFISFSFYLPCVRISFVFCMVRYSHLISSLKFVYLGF